MTIYMSRPITSSTSDSILWYDNYSTTSSAVTSYSKIDTTTTSANWYSGTGYLNNNNWYENSWYLVPDKKSRLKEIINKRCAPNIIINDRRKALNSTKDIREERARETLRKIIGDIKYLNFIKSGFISVKAKSGKVYQIFPGGGITCVFYQGKLIERLCIVLKGDFPPTDSLIMRFLLITNNENQFKSMSISHELRRQVLEYKEKNVKSLVELFKEIKVA